MMYLSPDSTTRRPRLLAGLGTLLVAAGLLVGCNSGSAGSDPSEGGADWCFAGLCPSACFETERPGGLAFTMAPPPGSEGSSSDGESVPAVSVHIGVDGFDVLERGSSVAPRGDCPSSGPTVCLADSSMDVGSALDGMREAGGENQRQRPGGSDLVGAYDWMGLYNVLVQLRAEYDNPDSLSVAADDDLPHALVVRTMHVAQTRLPEESYDDRGTFRKAILGTDDRERRQLFEQVRFGRVGDGEAAD